MSTTRTDSNNNNEEEKKEDKKKLSPEEQAKKDEEQKKRAAEDEKNKKASMDMLAYASPHLTKDIPTYTRSDGKPDTDIAIEAGNAQFKTPEPIKEGRYDSPGRTTIYVDSKGAVTMDVAHHLIDKNPDKYYREGLEFMLKHGGKDSPTLDFPNGMDLKHIHAALRQAKDLNMNIQFSDKLMSELEYMRKTDRIPYEPNVHDGRGQKLYDEIMKLKSEVDQNYNEKSKDTKLLVNYGRMEREMKDEPKLGSDLTAEKQNLTKGDKGVDLDHAGQVQKINSEVEKLDARMARLEQAQNALLGEANAGRNEKLSVPLQAARVLLSQAMEPEKRDIEARREFLSERLQHLEDTKPAADAGNTSAAPAPSAPPAMDVSDVQDKFTKANFTERLQKATDKVADVAATIQEKAQELDRQAALRQPK